MINDFGCCVKVVGLLILVLIIGLNEVLMVGDYFVVYEDEKFVCAVGEECVKRVFMK